VEEKVQRIDRVTTLADAIDSFENSDTALPAPCKGASLKSSQRKRREAKM
jgi:hypothetical protein